MKERNLTISLTSREAESIISALAKFPYEQVAQLISKIAIQTQEDKEITSPEDK